MKLLLAKEHCFYQSMDNYQKELEKQTQDSFIIFIKINAPLRMKRLKDKVEYGHARKILSSMNQLNIWKRE
jgi:hypothetical protein